MIDFHTHILPGIDDGSQNIETTETMLLEEKRQGVKLIAATPHFYANRTSIGRFLERRSGAMEKTKKLTEEADEPLPEIIAGAEVYYFEGIGDASEIGRLCIGETRTILLEMPFEQWNERILQDTEALISRQRLQVVLAHVERYIRLQRDRRVWERMMALPVIPQINAGSLIPQGGIFAPDRKRKFCLRLLEERQAVIIGSDCHDLAGRAPNLESARREIIRTLGPDAFGRTQETAGKALDGI